MATLVTGLEREVTEGTDCERAVADETEEECAVDE